MIRNTTLLSIVFSVLLLSTTAAEAQRPRRPMHSDEMLQSEKGEKPLRERMESLRKVKLLELLDLEGEAVERFFARYTPLQRAVYEAKDALDHAVRSLRMADKDNADDAHMAQRAAEVLRKQEELHRAAERRHTELKSILTPRQYARYVAFEAAFLDDIVRLMMHRIKR